MLDAEIRRAGLSQRDAAFCAALVYGVAERAVTLDFALSRYLRPPDKKLTNETRQILRAGLYQLLYMSGVEPYAAVNESVALCARFGQGSASGLVNAVLRAFLRDGGKLPPCRDEPQRLSVEYSLPPELIEFWRGAYPGKLTQILEGTRAPAPVFLRVNPLRTDCGALCASLAEDGVASRAVPEVPGALRVTSGDAVRSGAFARGEFHVQDLSSQLCAAALEVRPGMDVADFCAAPGGKTFTLAEMMEDRGGLYAYDLHEKRLALLREGARRLGLSCVHTSQNDATRFDPALPRFDRILCDAVCSGYGVIRRKPEIRYKPLSDIDGLPEIQYNILNTSAEYLKKGGRLVYSTCTLNPAENERVAERFLAAHPDFVSVGLRTYLRSDALDCDGFFVAAMESR